MLARPKYHKAYLIELPAKGKSLSAGIEHSGKTMNAHALGGTGSVHAAAITLSAIVREGRTTGIEVRFTVFACNIVHTNNTHCRLAIAPRGAA